MKSSSLIHSVLSHLMRRLVRFAMAKGVGLSQFEELLKRLYVQEAEQTIQQQGGRVTQSRISVMTGVHRKDVKRLLENSEYNPAMVSGAPLVARVIAQWLGDEQYIDAQGRACSIAIRGEAPSLEHLVQQSARGDVAARSVLEELRAAGLVEEKGEEISLVEAAIPGVANEEERLHFMARNVGDHLSASVENILDGAEHFERAVFYDQLSPEAVEQLEALVQDKGMELLKTVNRSARKAQSVGLGESRRLHVGLVCYATDEDDK